MPSWYFVHTGDIHRGSPRSFRFEPSAIENWETAVGQIKPLSPDLLLTCGDVSHDGWQHADELARVRQALDRLPFPCHSVAGNMDVGNKKAHHNGATGEDDIGHNIRSDLLKSFADNFGPYNWSFVHKDVRFTGLCDMLAGSGLPEEEALWDFLDSLRKQPATRWHVCVMHYPLFIDTIDEPTFDNRQLDQYEKWYDNVDKPQRLRIHGFLEELAVDIVFCGHVHHNRIRQAGGIRFIACTGTAFKKKAPPGDNNDFGFVRCEVKAEGIGAEFVPLAKESNARGYGPVGHDPVKDYSLAWEKPSYGEATTWSS